MIIFLLLQVTKCKKYKSWNLKDWLYIVIFLSCPLIGLAVELLREPIGRHLKTITDKKPGFGGPRLCTF